MRSRKSDVAGRRDLRFARPLIQVAIRGLAQITRLIEKIIGELTTLTYDYTVLGKRSRAAKVRARGVGMRKIARAGCWRRHDLEADIAGRSRGSLRPASAACSLSGGVM